MVLLNENVHRFLPFQPLESADGGVMGATDRGLLAVYVVPAEHADKFVASARLATAVIKVHELGLNQPDKRAC
jgi:hypothetical protein